MKQYVDNDVFRFRLQLKEEFIADEITIYTKPLPELDPIELQENLWEEYDKQDELVKDKYFTQKRIDEYKLKLIQKIQEYKNPFDISCTDRDGGYNVTEDQLFSLE